MFLTDEYIRQRYRAWLGEIDQLVAEERDKRIHDAGEKMRALWVLQSTDGKMSAAKAMSLYMVRPDIAKEILAEFDKLDDGDNNQKKRRDKYSAIQEWCLENVGVQVGAKQLAEIGEISYPTALKYISDHPDIFWRVVRGVYEVRDPAADRKKDKK
jgi:hypothetical protein